MIYVVEGLDRCGKTTFTNYLRSMIQNPKILVIHSSKPPSNVDPVTWTILYYGQLIDQCINLSKDGYDIILDRSWLGEVVYGPIYRNTNIPLRILEEQLLTNNEHFKMVVFIDNPSALVKRDDGMSLSNDLSKKEYEVASFKAAFDASVIESKYMFDWSHCDFSTDLLKNLAASLINGAINANDFGHPETITGKISK